eukprot:TRINITY_DN4130_c0_g1_i2.p1 TRINITY_DN4130_c0_g1~~TRINITY_DN4130_c0_g1_i2.p1  ORF type:complete len:1126 (+),score=218.00 TRINITY_DN4130_c0_g1_i2:426-3803(+)
MASEGSFSFGAYDGNGPSHNTLNHKHVTFSDEGTASLSELYARAAWQESGRGSRGGAAGKLRQTRQMSRGAGNPHSRPATGRHATAGVMTSKPLAADGRAGSTLANGVEAGGGKDANGNQKATAEAEKGWLKGCGLGSVRSVVVWPLAIGGRGGSSTAAKDTAASEGAAPSSGDAPAASANDLSAGQAGLHGHGGEADGEDEQMRSMAPAANSFQPSTREACVMRDYFQSTFAEKAPQAAWGSPARDAFSNASYRAPEPRSRLAGRTGGMYSSPIGHSPLDRQMEIADGGPSDDVCFTPTGAAERVSGPSPGLAMSRWIPLRGAASPAGESLAREAGSLKRKSSALDGGWSSLGPIRRTRQRAVSFQPSAATRGGAPFSPFDVAMADSPMAVAAERLSTEGAVGTSSKAGGIEIQHPENDATRPEQQQQKFSFPAHQTFQPNSQYRRSVPSQSAETLKKILEVLRCSLSPFEHPGLRRLSPPHLSNQPLSPKAMGDWARRSMLAIPPLPLAGLSETTSERQAREVGNSKIQSALRAIEQAIRDSLGGGGVAGTGKDRAGQNSAPSQQQQQGGNAKAGALKGSTETPQLEGGRPAAVGNGGGSRLGIGGQHERPPLGSSLGKGFHEDGDADEAPRERLNKRPRGDSLPSSRSGGQVPASLSPSPLDDYPSKRYCHGTFSFFSPPPASKLADGPGGSTKAAKPPSSVFACAAPNISGATAAGGMAGNGAAASAALGANHEGDQRQSSCPQRGSSHLANSTPCALAELPKDLLRAISSRVDHRGLAGWDATCHFFHDFLTEDNLWGEFCARVRWWISPPDMEQWAVKRGSPQIAAQRIARLETLLNTAGRVAEGEKGEGQGTIVLSHVQAERLHALAVTHGDAAALTELGVLLHRGEGLLQDRKRALRLFQLAADQGSVRGLLNVGEVFRSGKGAAKNLEEAQKWFQLADNRGDPLAKFNLGWVIHKRDNGATGEMLCLYRAAALTGDLRAQAMLGSLHYGGVHVEEDCSLAVKWLKMAVVNCQGGIGDESKSGPDHICVFFDKLWNRAAAMLLLGKAYQDGEGVPLDSSRAVELFEAGASLGSAGCIFQLAKCYAAGRGVPWDRREAARLRTVALEMNPKLEFNDLL